MMSSTCMQITIVPMVNGMPGTRERTYGRAEIGEDPKLARIDNEVPNAITKRMKTKLI